MKDNSLLLNRIKSQYNFKSDAAFARFLGLKPTTLANWYTRGTIDYHLLFTKCEGISGDFLLSGTGDVKRKETERFEDIKNHDLEKQDLMKEIISLQRQVITLQNELALLKTKSKDTNVGVRNVEGKLEHTDQKQLLK